MTQESVTDEMVNAALKAQYQHAYNRLFAGTNAIPDHAAAMRAALEAALSTQPKAVSADLSADRNWIAGAQWGFGRGLENDNTSLAEAIEARQRDIKAIIGEGD